MTTEKSEKPIYFDENGTGYEPRFISRSTTVDVKPGCYSVHARVTRKGRGFHHVNDPAYVDIPITFMNAHYPDLVSAFTR